MATTTNYGWTTPDDTALVKDGASAIRTLGSSVDTTVKALSPGTTAGDVDYYTSSTAKARLAIGTTGQVLTVAGGVPSWAAASGYSTTLIGATTLSGASTTISSIPTTYSTLLLVIHNATQAAAGFNVFFRINGDTTGYTGSYFGSAWGGTNAPLCQGTNVAHSITIRIDNAKATSGNKYITSYTQAYQDKTYVSNGILASSAAVTSITINGGGSNYSGGTIQLLGM